MRWRASVRERWEAAADPEEAAEEAGAEARHHKPWQHLWRGRQGEPHVGMATPVPLDEHDEADDHHEKPEKPEQLMAIDRLGHGRPGERPRDSRSSEDEPAGPLTFPARA